MRVRGQGERGVGGGRANGWEVAARFQASSPEVGQVHGGAGRLGPAGSGPDLRARSRPGGLGSGPSGSLQRAALCPYVLEGGCLYAEPLPAQLPELAMSMA